MSKVIRLFLPFPVMLYAAVAMAAPSKIDPRIETVLGVLSKGRSIHEAKLSPDGRGLAWVIDTNGRPAIELANATGHEAHSLNPTNESDSCTESDLAWAPDSRHLAYVSHCDASGASHDASQTELRVVDVDSRQSALRRVILKGGVQSLSWSADGRRLGFLYVPNATRQASSSAAAKPLLNEVGVGDMEVQRVAVLDADDTEPRLVTAANTYVYDFSWSSDAQQIAYIAAPPPGDNNWWIAKLYKQDAQADAAPHLLVDPGTVSGSLHGLQMALPRWSPDGSRIVFIGGLMSGVVGGDIYSIPAEGGDVVNLTPGIHATPVWLAWTSANKLLVAQIRDGRSQVAGYDVAADKATQGRVLLDVAASIGDGSALMALSLSSDGTHAAYIQSSYTQAAEVYVGSLRDGQSLPATAVNADLKPIWGKAESVMWDNQGYHVQGWLMYPVNYDATKTYPMIVMVHGGPASAVVPYWPGISFGGAASFSSLGYFVFMPNPRGSFGEGERYTQANRRDFGNGDLSDILAGVDAVEKKLPVDDKRLGLIGWSYGGFMSMFAPTQTQRFHAVVAGAGIANWQSYYGQNQIDQWTIPYFGVSVYDDPAVYAKISAINFIKRYKAPTLLLVGDRDAECPAAQSFEFWHALRAQNVPTSLVVYPNEGHAFADPVHRLDLLRRSMQWFERYLSGDDIQQRAQAEMPVSTARTSHI